MDYWDWEAPLTPDERDEMIGWEAEIAEVAIENAAATDTSTQKRKD